MRGAANAGDLGPETNRPAVRGRAWPRLAMAAINPHPWALTVAFPRKPTPDARSAWRGYRDPRLFGRLDRRDRRHDGRISPSRPEPGPRVVDRPGSSYYRRKLRVDLSLLATGKPAGVSSRLLRRRRPACGSAGRRAAQKASTALDHPPRPTSPRRSGVASSKFHSLPVRLTIEPASSSTAGNAGLLEHDELVRNGRRRPAPSSSWPACRWPMKFLGVMMGVGQARAALRALPSKSAEGEACRGRVRIVVRDEGWRMAGKNDR